MSDHPSLFAQKLRDWRTSNGTHGRMTQEALADVLGVSVDAIGKYERSVSFIRGDLEHRLAERLGWSREDILACREDWEARQKRSAQGKYRLLDEAVVNKHFGGSWHKAVRAKLKLGQDAFAAMPDEFSPSEEVFLPIYEAFPEMWSAVFCGNQTVALWTLLLLMQEDEDLFRDGRLIETALTVSHIRRPILPGTYFGYSPGLIIDKGHEAAAPMLLSSFVQFLEDLVERDIFLHGIGTASVSTEGEQICRELGMTHLRNHRSVPSFGIWILPGSKIADSVFARRSPLLRRRYAEVFKP